MLQTKITFHSKSKDHDDPMESNLKNKSSHLCNQLPIPSFTKVTQCIPFSIPSYNYDIGYLVSNYASYSSVAKTLSYSEVQHLVQSVFVPCKTFTFPKNSNGRSFQRSWIDKFPWLTYSKLFDGAFCLPSVLFGHSFPSECTIVERLFSKPFNYWNDASAHFKEHVFGKNNNNLTCRNKGLDVKTAEILFSLSSFWSFKTVVTVQAGFRQNMDVQCVSYYSNTVGSVKRKKRVLVMILWDIYWD